MDIGLKVNKQSVGWCVTDGMNIAKKQGKSLIGVTLFNEAETNEQRRIARLSRRTYDRRRQRVKFLNDVFKKEIEKTDKEFFKRIMEQGLYEEDRTTTGSVLGDKQETKEYLKKYPTIYHLRSDLLNECPDDIRLLYLALLHMYKARGNFLIKDVDVKSATSFHSCYAALRSAVSEHFLLPKNKEVESAMESILNSKDKIKEKQSKIMELFGIETKEKWMQFVIQLFLGGKVDVKKLFPEQLEGYEGETKITYNDCENYDELIAPFESELEIEQLELLNACKAVYDWNKLVHILNGERFISVSYMKRYYQHKEDRTVLQEILKYSDKAGITINAYDTMFKVNKCSEKMIDNYKSYIGDMKDIKKAKSYSCSKEAFYKYTEKILYNILETDNVSEEICEKIKICLEKIDFGTFLQKQRSKDNQFIPNIVLKDEMSCILNKACIKHPFLLKEGISGKEVREEILDVFSFQIPYWVGPVNDDESYGWAVRKEPGYVYPWNFEQKIDIVQTRRVYMNNIIGDCCLLADEKVLPDNSYYIRAFQCLNELNKIKICNEKLSVPMKQTVFNELTMKHERVTIKGFLELLRKEGYIDELVKEDDVTGFTKKKLNHTMAPYLKANAIYKDLTPEQYDIIAETITVCKNDRKLIFDVLNNLDIPKEDLTILVQCIKDSGWSEYSKKSVLEIKGRKTDDENAPERNVIETLYNTQLSLVELLSNEYTFMQEVEKANSVKVKSVDDLINEFKNPRQKRAYKQMVKVLKELKNYMPSAPEKVYVNLYVPNNTMVRKVNRKSELMKLLTKSKEKELLQQLKAEKALTLRKELYYLQRGYCIYSGSVIPYEELEKSYSEYNVEHILPQSKIYDESVNNLCLVKKSINIDKGNTYPIDETIRDNMLYMWDSLLEDGYMTQKKYEALTSKYGIPVERKLETVNTLLVEHRKTAKSVEKIIKRVLPNTEVVFVKDEILNNFKKKFNIYESDVINEHVPAREAYYVSVSGKTWNGIFGDNPLKYMLENSDYSLHVYNYNSEFWNTETSFKNITTQLDKSHVIQSVMAFTKENGQLYKMTNLGKDYVQKTKSEMAGKKGKFKDVSKYGGYISINNAYFCIINTNKGVIVESIPIMEVNNIKNDLQLIEYMENHLGYREVSILKRRVPKKATFIIDGHKYYLASISGGSLAMDNAVAYHMNTKEYKYMNEIIKFNKQMKTYGKVSKKTEEKITEKENIKLYDNFLEKYNSVYKNRKNACIEILLNGRDDFVKLELRQQCEALENIFTLVRRKAPIADLQAIGGKSMMGRIAINNNLSKANSVIMLEESATGLYVKKTKLI